MKTNKSFTKRLKVTRNGKILARQGGKNHFNAKASRKSQLAEKRLRPLQMSKTEVNRFLANS